MKMTKFRDVVQDLAGNAIDLASVAVTVASSGDPASLYSDSAGAYAIAGNTVLTDSRGVFAFYAPPGVYNITVSKYGAVIAQLLDVTLADSAGGGLNVSVDDFSGPNYLRNFFESAIANPGVKHHLLPRVYNITEELPTITASNVLIECPGAAIHDVGSHTGAILRWTGAAGVARMMKIAPVAGASNQRLTNIRMNGLMFDANNLAQIGLEARSVSHSDIWVATADATFAGLYLGVVATLGEGRDLRNNDIRVLSRQLVARAGNGMVLDGDSSANVSFNSIRFDAQHSDAPGAIAINVDNNDWWLCRTYKITGGTATDAVSLLGGADEPRSARLERFHLVSGNTPIHVYGTAGITPYAYPSTRHAIFCLDKGNATPDPVVEVGGSINWIRDDAISTRLAALGAYLGDNFANVALALSRKTTETMRLFSGADNQLVLDDGTNVWGIRTSGGSLEISRFAGTGGLILPVAALPTHADEAAAATAGLASGRAYRTADNTLKVKA